MAVDVEDDEYSILCRLSRLTLDDFVTSCRLFFNSAEGNEAAG